MDGTYKTKKHSADKIALLGLLVAALLIARLIVAWRSVILFSEPIKLNYTGLSVSIPSGNGWHSEKQWKYQENAFTLSSIFNPGSSNITSLISCRYLLAAAKATPDRLFKQKASEIGGQIAKTGQTFSDKLIIDWAHIEKPKMLLDIFFGTVDLPNNRRLDIEVHQTTGDADLAERLFKRIAEHLEFKDSKLLEAGSEIIAEIKSKGLNSFLENQSRQAFFLIRNARSRTIGFTMDVFIESAPDAQLNIQAASFFYIQGQYPQEQAAFFQSDNSFDEFTARSETSGPAGRSGTELILKKDAGFTVKKLITGAEGSDPVLQSLLEKATRKNFQLSPAAIPDVFGELTFGQLLNSEYRKILVDIIVADGTIMPTLVSRIETKDAIVAEEGAGYVLRVEFLDGRGFYEQVYLDGQKQIFKRVIRHDDIYVLESATAQEVLRQFPEQDGYILDKNKMLEQNQPRH